MIESIELAVLEVLFFHLDQDDDEEVAMGRALLQRLILD